MKQILFFSLIFLSSLSYGTSSEDLLLDPNVSFREIKQRASNFDDQKTLNTIQYILAGRKILAEELGKSYNDLKMVEAFLEGTEYHPQYPKELLLSFPPSIYPEFYNKLQKDFKIKKMTIFDGLNENWLRKLTEKSLHLIQEDCSIINWRYRSFPDDEWKNKMESPSYEIRERKIAKFNYRKNLILQGADQDFLTTPFYSDLLKKDKLEFLFFVENPAYLLYQRIASIVLHDEERIYLSPLKFTDERFQSLITFAAFLGEDLKNSPLQIKEESIEKIKSFLLELVKSKISKMQSSLELLSPMPDFRGINQRTPFLKNSIFFKLNESFIKHYSFLYFIPLHEKIYETYQGHDELNLFQSKLSREELLQFSMQKERDLEEDTISGQLYMLGGASMLFPYAQIISPLFFLSGLGYQVLQKDLPHFKYSMKTAVIFKELKHPIWGDSSSELAPEMNEVHDRQRILQKSKASLAFSAGVEPVLSAILSGAGILFMKKLSQLKHKDVLKDWDETWKKILNSFTKNETIQRNAAKSRPKTLGVIAKHVISTPPVIIAAGYFISFLTLQGYFDQVGDQKEQPALNLEEFLNSIDDSYGPELKKDEKILKNLFKNADQYYSLQILSPFYLSNENEWLKLYNGDKVLHLFGKTYFPKKVYEELSNNSKKFSIMSEMIIQNYLFQSTLELDLLKILFQKNLKVFFEQNIKSPDPVNDQEIKNSIMTIQKMATQILSNKTFSKASIDEVRNEAVKLSMRYSTYIEENEGENK